MLDLADLRRSRKALQYGTFRDVDGALRQGAERGSAQAALVLLVPEMDWVVDTLKDWVTDLRPRFTPGNHPALWITERRGRSRHDDQRSLRRGTHEGRPGRQPRPTLLETQLRHPPHRIRLPRTLNPGTSRSFLRLHHEIYTGVSNEFRNKLLEAALRDRLGDEWDATS